MSDRRQSFSLKPLMRWETLLFFLLIASLIWGAERSPYFWEGSNFKVATSTFMGSSRPSIRASGDLSALILRTPVGTTGDDSLVVWMPRACGSEAG